MNRLHNILGRESSLVLASAGIDSHRRWGGAFDGGCVDTREYRKEHGVKGVPTNSFNLQVSKL